MKKIFSFIFLLSLSCVFTIFSHEGMAATEEAWDAAAGTHPSGSAAAAAAAAAAGTGSKSLHGGGTSVDISASGGGAGGSFPMPGSRATARAAASAAGGIGSPAVAGVDLPIVNIEAIRAYLRPIIVPSVGLPLDLTSLSLGSADVYSAVGIVLAGHAAMHPEAYSVGSRLTAAQLAEANVPAIFEGWTVTGVMDGMNPARRAPVVGPRGAVSEGDNFDAKHPNIFGLAVDAPTASGGVPFRWCFFSAPLPDTLKELLLGSLSMLRRGDPIAAQRECRQRVITNMGISSENLDALGFKKITGSPTDDPTGEKTVMIEKRRLWMDKCVKRINPWLCGMKPNGTAGHSVAGAYLNAMLRAMETSGGDPAEMARNIQHVRIFNASGTSLLVELTRSVLHGEGSIETFDHLYTPTMYTMTGPAAERFAYFNRDTDVFGETGITFGEVKTLPEKPLLMRSSPGAARARPAAPEAPAAGWGLWNAVARLASAVTGAFTTAAAPTITLDDLQHRILTIHGARGMMTDLLVRYREQLAPVRVGAAAGGAGGVAAAPVLATWDEAVAATETDDTVSNPWT